MTTPGGFADQVAAWVGRTEARLLTFARSYAYEVTRELVLRSPVGDPKLWQDPPPPGYVGGHFRANWQVGIDSRPSGEVEGVDPSGARTIGRAVGTLAELKLGGVVYVSNNLPYARRLEYGWSSQAPDGIVRVTIAQKDALIARALAAARSPAS